jgi:ABC-type dipeptide/oligopeptide/nickel transport system ATPase component
VLSNLRVQSLIIFVSNVSFKVPRWIPARVSKTEANLVAQQHMDGVGSGGSGSGWSAEPRSIMKLIEQDREKRGMVFNQEFLNYVCF